MDLTVTGELAKHLITMTRKDGKLAEAMARQYLKAVSSTQIATYLLTPEVALRLLAERLHKNPEQTLRQLQDLTGQGGRARRAKGKSAARAKSAPTGKRVRLSIAEVEGLKAKVRGYLGHHPWSNRKQLFGAVAFPSLAAYNRILGELRDAGEVQASGEKSKTVYALRGAKGEAKVASTKKAAPKAKRAGKARRKPRKSVAEATARTKRAAAPRAKPKARAKAKKSAANVRLCPVPGCSNRAAPRFGMLCKEHKDISKTEREKFFAARRAAKAAAPPKE